MVVVRVLQQVLVSHRGGKQEVIIYLSIISILKGLYLTICMHNVHVLITVG